MESLVALTIALSVGIGSHHAIPPTQVLTVENPAHVQPSLLRKVESEVVGQVAIARKWWPMPQVRFGSGGWPVTLFHGSPVSVCGADADGCHSVDGMPWAAVGVERGSSDAPNEEWEMAFSHEVLEVLSDPSTLAPPFQDGEAEICDLTSGWDYMENGVWLSDFTLPEAYAPNPHGRVDFMRAMSGQEILANRS